MGKDPIDVQIVPLGYKNDPSKDWQSWVGFLSVFAAFLFIYLI